jgi:hypothetical protein
MNRYLIPLASVIAIAGASQLAAQSTPATTQTNTGIGMEASTTAPAPTTANEKGIGAHVSATAHKRNSDRKAPRTGAGVDETTTATLTTTAPPTAEAGVLGRARTSGK